MTTGFSGRPIGRVLAVTGAVIVAVMSAACGTRTVNEILADPTRYRDREVRVSGTVEESFSIVGRGAYRVDDNTGELWVISDRGVPRKGARVSVKGRIREGFNVSSLGGLNLPAGVGSGLVMVETSHRAD